MRHPHPHLGGGGSRDFANLRTHVDGGGRGVIFSSILCGRHKCMLPNTRHRRDHMMENLCRPVQGRVERISDGTGKNSDKCVCNLPKNPTIATFFH